MILPRLSIGKILVQVYDAIEHGKIVTLFWNDKLVSIDGIEKKVYSATRPNFLLANLFQYWEIDENTWKFETTIVYNQLVGKEVSCLSEIMYLKSRYPRIEDRVRHYVDFVINL